VNFERSVTTAFGREGGFTAAFDRTLGIGTLGTGPAPLSYASGSLLAKLDTAMGRLEYRAPYGGGSASSPTGGVGLSNKTNLTTRNPGEPVDPVAHIPDSVAELMETEITLATNASTLRSNMNQGRAAAEHILPAYVEAFGPRGARDFGLQNT